MPANQGKDVHCNGRIFSTPAKGATKKAQTNPIEKGYDVQVYWPLVQNTTPQKWYSPKENSQSPNNKQH